MEGKKTDLITISAKKKKKTAVNGQFSIRSDRSVPEVWFKIEVVVQEERWEERVGAGRGKTREEKQLWRWRCGKKKMPEVEERLKEKIKNKEQESKKNMEEKRREEIHKKVKVKEKEIPFRSISLEDFRCTQAESVGGLVEKYTYSSIVIYCQIQYIKAT